ncbi:MAG: hypothetical protein WD229_04170, partial [Pirellulales bacterium]
MKRFFLVCLMVVPAAGGLITQSSRAQDPAEILDHYRLLPRLSTLHQMGGIAGINQRYLLTGKYDFAHGSGWTAKASFENAEIWGSLISKFPTPAFVIDVDHILNLEGLRGEALPVGAPFDVYQFTGHTSDGSSVQLFASVIGSWMYVRGATHPPAGSADYFTYHIQALARSRPFADFNGNGIVDAADYVMLRNSDPDSGGIGIVGSDDVTAGAGFAEWMQQFGETVPDLTTMDSMMSAALGSSVTTATVPEPASAALVILGGLILA